MNYQNVELHNVCDIFPLRKGKEFGISRLPLDILEDINPGARGMCKMGSSCEIRGRLKKNGSARIVLRALDDNVVPPTVLVFRGEFLDKAVVLRIGKKTEILLDEHPSQVDLDEISKSEEHVFDSRLIRVVFPPIHHVNIVSIEGDWSMPKRKSKPSKMLLSYGSSITHGASAVFPMGTYTAQCARRLGMDMLDLGLGGAAQMDLAIAKHIASRKDWDVATLEMGINVRGWSKIKFEKAVLEFVGTIAKACPRKEIFCIDLFTNDGDYTIRHSEKVSSFRKIVKKIVKKIGSDRVHYVNGKKLLTDSRGLWTDLVHPNDFGMEEIGRKLSKYISEKISK